MKRAIVAATILLAAAAPLRAQTTTTAPYEIVKDDIDMEAAPDGRFWEVVEVHYRPLTSQGVGALQKITLSYTAGYEALKITAYTLKKDGRRIDIPAASILQGHGETTSPGFEDTRTMTVVFPNLEIGDEAVLINSNTQLVPWFPDIFAATQTWPPEVPVREARFAFTSQDKDAGFHITSQGVTADPVVSAGGKTRHVWHYRNDNPALPEPEAVNEIASRPHVAITTLPDYAGVADIYRGVFKDRAQVTPEIASLADKLTSGTRDRRAQAKILYEWVAAHIRYVNIVLGAGGFVPHKAADVLKNGYGDCKDHVMLLEAMLKAEGIDSTPVLINVGSAVELPKAASPFNFNHMITYVPAFGLFLDSTSRYAPFGTLPVSDQGKPVVLVKTAEVVTTPRSGSDTMHVVENIQLHENGTADGDTEVTSTGDAAITLRALLASVPAGRDADLFRVMFGPGATGTIERGDTDKLTNDYAFKAHYTIPNFVNLPGPGALPVQLGFSPLSFSALIGPDLPERRTRAYACTSLSGDADVTMSLPQNLQIVALPKPIDDQAGGISLQSTDEVLSGNRFHQHTEIRVTHPTGVCDATEYNASHDTFANMLAGLKAQALYK